MTAALAQTSQVGDAASAALEAVDPRIAHAWQVLADVLDPEVPVVSVCELGIVRDVRLDGDGIEVVLTPTYSGCPATEVIEAGVRVHVPPPPSWA